MSKFIVVTTINPPTRALNKYTKIKGWQLVSVGDTKTPKDWRLQNTVYLNPKDQDEISKKLSEKIGWKKYSRKNLGYIYAIKNNAQIISEVDDDIAPYKTYPHNFDSKKEVILLSGPKFINIYKYFKGKKSWPRGYPVDQIFDTSPIKKETSSVYTPIQNSLLDLDGDFDAIYRLTSNKKIKFLKKGEYALKKGTYCPFHSGNTFWHPEAFPLLYMPSFVSPHVEDIWRGYIAQRLIWETSGVVNFVYPTAYTSNRNVHNYLKDFKNEIPMFLQTNELIKVLDNLSLNKDLLASLQKTYKALVKAGIMQKEELEPLTLWLKELVRFGKT